MELEVQRLNYERDRQLKQDSFMVKMMFESKNSDERFQIMMERVQEQQIRMDVKLDNLSHVILGFLQRLPRPRLSY
jgi:hypothetical protein